MTATDRVFRALGRAEPEAFLDLVRAFAPGIVPEGVAITTASVDDPQLDVPPPPMDADWLGRAGESDLFHIECQGYRDRGFPDRLFNYHLRLVARYPGLRVHTVALWLIDPPAAQEAEVIERGDVRVRITSVRLSRLPAAELLRHARTACFASGAEAGEWSAAELCGRVARALRDTGAGWHARQVACLAAAIRGRYKEMVSAMRQEQIEPVILEDFVKYGEDVGYERGLAAGLAEGTERGLAEGLVAAYEARFGPAPVALRDAIARTHDRATLLGWYRALGERSAEEIVATVVGQTSA